VLYPVAALARLREELEQVGQPYPDPQRPGVWRVPLKDLGGADREALIDEQDLPIVDRKSRCWRARTDRAGGAAGAGGSGDVILHVDGRQRPLQRLILGLTDPAALVGFANGDPLDCRRANLVVRTRSQVGRGRRPSPTRDGKRCASAFKGVTFDRKCGKWRATIRRDEMNPTIGVFDDETAAAEAYDDCARVWFGEHAYLNFPDRGSTEEKRAWAQGILDRAIERDRRRVRRVKKIGRLLRREALARSTEAAASAAPAPSGGPMIGRAEARRLLGVPRGVWRRWERRGWIAGGQRVAGRRMYPVSLIKHLLERCGRLRPPYPDPQRANVWRVPLAFSGRRSEVLIDAASLPLLEGGWCVMSGMRAEPGADAAYVSFWSPATKEHRPLRRLVVGVTDDGTPAGPQVGHRNDDPMDCRRENLIVVTPAQRSYRNRKIRIRNGKPTTSEFKGVSWHAKGKKWTAMIHGCGTHRYLGMYVREEEAALAYDRAARELYGEHARLNFPDGIDAWLARDEQSRIDAQHADRAEAA
jgi:hypothetical protein